MLSIVLFVSGGEIFLILMFVLIFFGADKIPGFAQMMGKGVREFKKAADDIKREINDSTSGVMDDFKSIQNNLTDTLTKKIAEPVQETVKEAEKTFEEYQDQYYRDDYYGNPDYMSSYRSEYQEEAQAPKSESTDTAAPDTPVSDAGDPGDPGDADENLGTEPSVEPSKPEET